MEHLVRRSAELHFLHICTGGDPFEMGSSRPLDFGHWAAHKLESLSGHAVSHAHAVAIGLAMDVTYSKLRGWLAADEAQRILHVLETLGLPVFHPLLGNRGADGRLGILAGLDEFRSIRAAA